MSAAGWAEQDTTPERIEGALRELLRERHAADETLVPARSLNLVVIADREWRGEIVNRLEAIGRFHPSRTILCTVEEGRRSLDGRAVVSDEDHSDGTVGVLHEFVEVSVGSGQAGRIDTIIDPILVAELPTVLWSPHSHDDAVEALMGTIDVILIDTDDPVNFDGPSAGLRRGAELLDGRVHVVDLAWLRTVPWRERLAGLFADPGRDGELGRLKRLYVRHNPSSVVSSLLLTGWLASKLGWEPEMLEAGSGGNHRGRARRADGSPVMIEFNPVHQEVRGIAGVTVSGPSGFSLALDRGPGGLRVREQRAGSKPREWRLFGASRGEGGILGEGVRQALLQDPTYGPALEAARSFST